jgi:hypothetical protein
MKSENADSKPMPLETHDLHIGGTRCKASSGLYFQTDNPFSGEVVKRRRWTERWGRPPPPCRFGIG